MNRKCEYNEENLGVCSENDWSCAICKHMKNEKDINPKLQKNMQCKSNNGNILKDYKDIISFLLSWIEDEHTGISKEIIEILCKDNNKEKILREMNIIK